MVQWGYVCCTYIYKAAYDAGKAILWSAARR